MGPPPPQKIGVAAVHQYPSSSDLSWLTIAPFQHPMLVASADLLLDLQVLLPDPLEFDPVLVVVVVVFRCALKLLREPLLSFQQLCPGSFQTPVR